MDLALKFFKEVLKSEKLTVTELIYLVEEYKLFTEKFYSEDMAMPYKHHDLMCTLASYIVLHSDEFEGDEAFAMLQTQTHGYLAFYLTITRPQIKLTLQLG